MDTLETAKNETEKNIMEMYHPEIPLGSHPILNKEFVLKTNALNDFFKDVKYWILTKTPGAIVVGPSRIGKSTGKRMLKAVIARNFGVNVPTFQCSCTAVGKISEKEFWSCLLRGLNQPIYPKDKGEDRRERVIRTLLDIAKQGDHKRLILLIDEAQNLKELHYLLLMDVYNYLEDKGIVLTVILFATPEIQKVIDEFRKKKNLYITGRFMRSIHYFKGLCSEKDIIQALSTLDTKCFPDDSTCTFTQYFFPQAYAEGYRVTNEASLILKLITEALTTTIYDTTLEISMTPFADMITKCFAEAGFEGKSHYKPTPDDWALAVQYAKFQDYKY